MIEKLPAMGQSAGEGQVFSIFSIDYAAFLPVGFGEDEMVDSLISRSCDIFFLEVFATIITFVGFG